MQRAKTHVMISIFLMSFIYLFGIRIQAEITTFTLNNSARIVVGGAVTSTISLGSILEGDSVLFSGTCVGEKLGDLTLACDKSGNDTIWTDSGSEHMGNRLGVVTATDENWSMSVGQEYTFEKPGLYRIFCWSYGVPGPMTYIQVRPKKPGIPTNVKINGGGLVNGADFFASGKDTLTLNYTLNWDAVTSYVSIGEYHSGTNWPDVTGWAGKETGLGTNRVVTISIDIFDLMQKAQLGNGTYRLCIYAGSGRGGKSSAYIIWIRVGWTLKAGSYSGGTLTIANANNANEKYATTSAGTFLFQNKPFKITAKPSSGYYLEKVVITKRHYTSKTTYTDTDVTQYSTPTQSQYQSGSICYHAVGNNSYITPSVDEVIVTPYFVKQKTLAVSVANIDRVYEDLDFNGIMVVSYANSGTVQYGTSTSYGYTAKVTQSDGQIQLSGVKRKNVGTTTVYWRVYVDETYQVKTGSFTITVTQRPIDVIAYNQTITYGSSIDMAHTSAMASGVAMYHVITAVTLTPSTGSVTSNGTITPSAATIYNANRTENTTSQYKINYIAGKLVINKKELTPTVNANNKTYDGTAVGGGSISLKGVVSGDTVTATATSYTFDSKNIGTGKTVTALGITLSGASSGNYFVASSATGTANITAMTLSYRVHANDKVYDGTTDAVGSIELTNKISGDSVSATAESYTFADKNVGMDKIVTANNITLSGTDAKNYTIVSHGNGVADITAKIIIPHVTANNKTYDATTDIYDGTLYLDGIIGKDVVALQAENFAFDSPLPGERNAVATELYLIGTDKDNYVLSTNTCSVPATISPYGAITVSCVSPYINTAQASFMQTAIQQILPFTLPSGCTYTYGNGTFGTATTDYTRTEDFYDALGKITDTFSVNILIDGITVVYGNMNVTTGTNTVYGDNQYTNVNLLSSSILKFDTPWTTDASHNASIETNSPTNVTFRVYLRQGEKLNVGTNIGLYYGRVDITVKQGNREQAKDKIDAFFPVSYEEEYTISNMHSSVVQDEINATRGDFWSAVPEFIAATDALYNVTMRVAGSSYLLDAEYGLGNMYAGNSPANLPKTTLCYISIY